MYDKAFLEWLRDRLHFVHGEKRNIDYMIKLQSIINATPVDKLTPSIIDKAMKND